MRKTIYVILLFVIIFQLTACLNKNDKSTSADLNTGIINYRISFETNGGVSISDKYATKLNNAPTTTKAGYILDAWYIDRNFQYPVIYPMEIDHNLTIYAKWLPLSSFKLARSGDFKCSSIKWRITPEEFDFQRYAELGYRLKIIVTYSIEYKKDYDVLWDIGYMGSPLYEVYLYDSDGYGNSHENVPIFKNGEVNTIETTISANQLINSDIYFKVSSDNIQNRIYVNNISIKYNWYKSN